MLDIAYIVNKAKILFLEVKSVLAYKCEEKIHNRKIKFFFYSYQRGVY